MTKLNTITTLGTNSAIPSIYRFTTSQYLNVNGVGFIVDCGEGAQIRLKQYGIKNNSISYVLISHLHGDHFFGLAGLISTMCMENRHKPLHIFGPERLEEVIEPQLEVSNTTRNFKCVYHVVDTETSNIIVHHDNVEVITIPLKHSVKTTGYLIKLTLPLKQCSYAYISDTIYKPDIVPLIQNVDVIYHEATYLHDLKNQADEKFHATAKEAGMIAQMANAKTLLIGHFSKRYPSIQPLVDEAKSIFPNTIAAEDGLCVPLFF